MKRRTINILGTALIVLAIANTINSVNQTTIAFSIVVFAIGLLMLVSK